MYKVYVSQTDDGEKYIIRIRNLDTNRTSESLLSKVLSDDEGEMFRDFIWEMCGMVSVKSK